VSEIGFTGNMRGRDTRIETIMSSLFFIPNEGEEGFEIGELLQVSEQLQEKEADRIIGMSSHRGVGWSDDGSHERKIDQGSDKASESTGNLPRGFDLDPSGDKGVRGEKSAL
jgi:hypothetical protein